MVGLIAWQYGWSIFFYNDFARYLHPLLGSRGQFALRDYTSLMYDHIMSAINHSYVTIFMALHVLNIGRSLSLRKLSFDKLFVLLIPAVLFIRFVLHPDISDRFYIAYYMVIVVLLVKNFSLLFQLPQVSFQKEP